nr:hypothetical protein [Actinobacillus seminis]
MPNSFVIGFETPDLLVEVLKRYQKPTITNSLAIATKLCRNP